MSAVLAPSSAPHTTAWFEYPPHRLQVAPREMVAWQAAAQLALELNDILARQPYAVLTPSVGRTMLQIHRILREDFRDAVDWARVICVQMDEYAGLAPHDTRSFAHVLRRDFIDPLGVGCFLHFNGDDGRPLMAPEEYEASIVRLGGLDCALHGVGRNGHIGFNEPGQESAATGMVRLHDATREANGVEFQFGFSLGLDLFRAARSSIVVLLGAEKRDAAHALLYGEEGIDNPVASVRRSGRVHILLDFGAMPAEVRDAHPAALTLAACTPV
jgi:glucosamine-6-phosphate deaminase